MTEYTAPLPRWKPALAFYHFLARYPLRVTFPAFMVAGFLVMLVDTYVHEIRTNREHALVQMTSQVITTSREAAAHFSHALYNQHAGDVGSTLNALALEGDFEAGALVDEDGKLLAVSGAQAAGSSFDKKNFGLRGDHELGASTEVIGSFMYSVVPVMSPAQEGRPSRQIARFYRRDRTAAVLANAHAVARSEAARHTLEFGLVMLLLWWVGERVYRARLSCIETAASAVSGGELGVRVNLIGCDELTRLAHAFNDMVGKLEADRARALAQSEALETSNAELEALRSALDAHAIVSMTDEFGAIVHANDKFCEISGYGRDELLGQNHSLLKSGVHGEEVYRQLWTTIRDGRAWHGVLQNRRKDGTPYWVQSSILPLGSKTATHGGYISLRTDITERERLRVALERLARTDTMQAPFDLFSEALAFGLDASRTGVVRFVENNQRQRLLGSWPASAEPEESIVQGCAAAIRDGAAGFSQCTCLTTSFPHDPLLVGHDQDCLFVEPIIDLTGAPIGMLYAIRRCRPADESSMRALLSTVARRAAGEIQLLSMERAQVRQQAWLEFVMQGAGAAVWDRDLITGAVKFNEQFAKMLGYELAELEPVVDTWQRAIHADDVAAAVDAVDAHLAGETDRYQAEYRLRTRHGDYIWVLDRGAITVRAPDGRPLHLAGVQMDITVHKQAQLELEKEQQRLSLILDHVPLGLWGVDLNSGVAWASPQWLSHLGFDARTFAVTQQQWGEMLHPEDRERVINSMQSYLDGELPIYAVDYRLQLSDGSWRWIMSRAVVSQFDDHGRPLQLMGIQFDIDDRKQAETALMQSEARLRAVLDNSPTGIFWADTDGALQYINASLRHNFGLVADQGSGHSWMEMLHLEDKHRVTTAWRSYIAGDDDILDTESRFLLPNQDQRTVHVRVARTHGGGSSIGFVGVLEDITEVREQEAEHERLRLQIQQAQKMEAVGQLAGGIAHDFNNILASVIGFGSLARERFARDADSKLAEYLNAVITAGERGRDLVAKMLSFSRATPSGQAQALEPVAVAREVAHLLSTIIPSSIHFDLDVHEPVPMVSIDAVDIHQVLVNLVVNARDAVSSHGHIRITVDGKAARQGHCAACQAPINGEYVAITVRDDGCGMDERTVARIFDPFYTTKDVGKGTGMGLSVVHGIMHRAGGHVMVNSTPGAGTEFVMLLRPASGTINSVSTEVRPAVSVAGLRVLVVDDEPLVRNFIGELLQGEGARPTLAADGREAQAMFAATPADFDVVFTDQTMPGLTGLELTAALREARADVPVVLCSGYSDRATRDVARAGGVIFLGKPAESQAILDALHTAVQGARH